MLAYARALGVTYYVQNYASIIRQPVLVHTIFMSAQMAVVQQDVYLGHVSKDFQVGVVDTQAMNINWVTGHMLWHC